jgi:chromosome segregation ATPase
MSCLSAERITQLQGRLTRLETQLTNLESQMDEAVAHLEMLSLDTGEAKQITKYRSVLKELYPAQELLWSQIDRTQHLLGGTGVVNLNLRRKNSGVRDGRFC